MPGNVQLKEVYKYVCDLHPELIPEPNQNTDVKALKALLNFLKAIKMEYFKKKVDTATAKA